MGWMDADFFYGLICENLSHLRDLRAKKHFEL